MKLILIALMVCSSWVARAEYRVYQLKITDQKTGISRLFLSNLLPSEYTRYNTLAATETLVLVDHWMCWKRSDGFKAFCPRPIASNVEGPKTGSPSPEKPALTP